MLKRTTSGLLVLAFYDGSEKTGEEWMGTHFITLIDLNANRACIDVPLNGPQPQSFSRLTLVGDTIVSLHQAVSSDGRIFSTFIRRHVIRPARCRWLDISQEVLSDQ